ncbi:hypothetical protein RHODOSMS8_00017 [Rhodobiaceae bacterium]|nr:hypothetical protein RHODOSMS8_00017 [Rhodobiaceae bacterium]
MKSSNDLHFGVAIGGAVVIGIIAVWGIFATTDGWERSDFINILVAIGTIGATVGAFWGVRAARRTQEREWKNTARVARDAEVRRGNAVQVAVSMEMKRLCQQLDEVGCSLNVFIGRPVGTMAVEELKRLRAKLLEDTPAFSALIAEIGDLDPAIAQAIFDFYTQYRCNRRYLLTLLDQAGSEDKVGFLQKDGGDLDIYSARIWVCWEKFRCNSTAEIAEEPELKTTLISKVPDLEATWGETPAEWAKQALDYIGHGD